MLHPPMQKPELISQPEVLPKLKKVAKPKEEPKKEEPKRTKVKIPKAKKYEDLPEIPDYERPELEVYEESEFDPSKLEKGVATPSKKAEQAIETKLEPAAEPAKNGLPKVSYFCVLILFVIFVDYNIYNHHSQWMLCVFSTHLCAPIDFRTIFMCFCLSF